MPTTNHPSAEVVVDLGSIAGTVVVGAGARRLVVARLVAAAHSSHWGWRGGSSNQIGATTSGRRARHSAVRTGHGRNCPTPLPRGVAMNL